MKTHFICVNTPTPLTRKRKIDCMEKYSRARHVTKDVMECAHCLVDT